MDAAKEKGVSVHELEKEKPRVGTRGTIFSLMERELRLDPKYARRQEARHIYLRAGAVSVYCSSVVKGSNPRTLNSSKCKMDKSASHRDKVSSKPHARSTSVHHSSKPVSHQEGKGEFFSSRLTPDRAKHVSYEEAICSGMVSFFEPDQKFLEEDRIPILSSRGSKRKTNMRSPSSLKPGKAIPSPVEVVDVRCKCYSAEKGHHSSHSQRRQDASKTSSFWRQI